MTLDIVDDLGHAIDDRSMQFAIERLRYTVPKHYFDEALSGSTPKRGRYHRNAVTPADGVTGGQYRDKGKLTVSSTGRASASRRHRPIYR